MAYCCKTTIAVCAALVLSSCGSIREAAEPGGEEQHESRTVALDKKAQRVRVDLRMAAGELQIRGGADDLLQGDFTYNPATWKPDIRYSPSDATGELRIEQHGVTSSSGHARNRWDLKFNNTMPLDFRAEFGAGEAKLELGSLNLRSVAVHMGAGKLNVDLRGTPAQDYSVEIRGGVGEATVRLPKGVGVAAVASGGIGGISVDGLHKDGDRYVNDAWDRASRRIRLDIQGGVGSIRLIAD